MRGSSQAKGTKPDLSAMKLQLTYDVPTRSFQGKREAKMACHCLSLQNQPCVPSKIEQDGVHHAISLPETNVPLSNGMIFTALWNDLHRALEGHERGRLGAWRWLKKPRLTNC